MQCYSPRIPKVCCPMFSSRSIPVPDGLLSEKLSVWEIWELVSLYVQSPNLRHPIWRFPQFCEHRMFTFARTVRSVLTECSLLPVTPPRGAPNPPKLLGLRACRAPTEPRSPTTLGRGLPLRYPSPRACFSDLFAHQNA